MDLESSSENQTEIRNLFNTDRIIRKASIRKLTHSLRNAKHSDSKIEIQNLLIQICEEVFGAPRLATDSPLLSGRSKTRSKQLDLVESSVLSAFSLLLSLRSILPHTSSLPFLERTCKILSLGEFGEALLDGLWTVIECRVSELSIKSYDLFVLLFKGYHGMDMETGKLEMTFQRLVIEFDKLESNERKLTVSLMNSIHAILNLFQSRNLNLGLKLIPSIIPHFFAKLLAEESEVRNQSRIILINLVEKFLFTNQDIEDELLRDAFSTLCQSITSISTEDLVENFDIISPIIKTLFSSLGRRNGAFAGPILTQLGSLHDSAPPSDDPASPLSQLKVSVERLIGQGVTSLGVRTILSYLPLQLKEVMEGQIQIEPRTWILPILKRSVFADELLFWFDELLPVMRILQQKLQELVKRDEEMEFKFKVLENQIWSLLPVFCQMPRDLVHALPCVSETLREVFLSKTDFQDSIALAMSRLWKNTANIVKMSNQSPGLDSCTLQDLAERLNLDFNLFNPDASGDEVIRIGKDALECFKKDGIEWFEALVSVFLKKKQNISRNLYIALTSLSMIFDAERLRSILQRLLTQLQEVLMNPARAYEQALLLDLIYVLLEAMDTESILEILRLIEMILKSNVTPQCGKKAYKLLAFIMDQKKEAWIEKSKELCVLLESLSLNCHHSSLHFRLSCIGELLLTILTQQQPNNEEIVISFLPEIVLGLEGESQKVQNRSKECLEKLGQHYSQRGRFDVLLRLLQFGLSSSELSTIISTIRALTYLMEESYGILFIQDLSKLLSMILDLTQDKEQLTSSFVSSIIQFLNQTSMIQSPEELSLNLERIMLFLMGEDGIPMRKCQQETKKLLAKLGEKLSFAKLDPLVPQKYSQVMRNLRSAQLRQLRRNEASSIEAPLSTSKTTTTRVPQSTLTKLMNLSVKDVEEEEEAQDLLEPSEARKLAKQASGVDDEIQEEAAKEPEFVLPVNEEGKLVISDQTLKKAERKMGNQLKRSKEFGSETDVTSKSNKRTRKSETQVSRGSKPTTTKSHISGNRFKAKKGAGGDAKGRSRFEPFAYWKFDRNLLNKRRGKQSVARRDLKRMAKRRTS